jgi:hypothetical protein
MDITRLPIFDPDPALTAKLNRDRLIAEGRAAFCAGQPVTACQV